MTQAVVTYNSTERTLICSCGNTDWDAFQAAELDGTALHPDDDVQFEMLWDCETRICLHCKSVFRWNAEEAFKVEIGGDTSHVQPIMVTNEITPRPNEVR